ncbi:MAG: methyltransferase domain-containing protein, partial [Rhodospirillales bacterium]|nr:methyltransferase domain-containing protein [Rhodospirillales bacterium]
MTTETSTTLPCRLCGGPTELRFHQIVLNRHRVGFHECLDCNSLQTEAPFWLDEAYADPRPLTDVGIVQRTLDLTMRLDPLLLRFEATNQQVCLDFGGNNGLFTRMMRDKGYNFFCYDRYVPNFYTPCHDATTTPVREAAVITAFEVLEHLSDPARDLDEIFGFDPDVVIATTETYRGQDSDWGYLSLDNGQHVFFYSLAALDRIATQRGYRLLSNGNLHIFHRLRPKFLSYGADASGAVGHWLLNPGKLETAALECFIKRRDDPYRFVLHDYSDIVQAFYATTPGLDATEFVAGAKFLDSYRTAFKMEPTYGGHYSYDAMYVLSSAIRRAGSTKPDAIVRELHRIDAYAPVTGSMRF